MKDLKISKYICFSLLSLALVLASLSTYAQDKSEDIGLPINNDIELGNAPLYESIHSHFSLHTAAAVEVMGVLDGVKAEPKFAIKTNLVPYILGVLNASIELPISDKFSVDIPIYYSPYTIDTKYRFRTLSFQPELRYWFRDVMDKHFIGFHAILGWYEVSIDDVAYQDRDGDIPAYGFGLSYGYFINLSQRFALELTGGFGYMHTRYDKYYNIEGGSRFENGERDYLGYTKIGVSIVYKFNKK